MSGTLNVKNTHVDKTGEYTLNINKVDENGARLEGATFKIEQTKPEGEGTIVENDTTTRILEGVRGNSEVKFKYNKKGDYEYTITETGTPEGYEPLAENVKLIVHVSDNPGEETLQATGEISNGNGIVFNSNNNTLEVTNTSIDKSGEYKLVIKKVDENGARLAGATFKIEAVNGNAKDKEKNSFPGTVTSTTNKTDLATFTYTQPGTYIYKITETNPPAGYNKLLDNVEFTIEVTEKKDNDGKVILEAKLTHINLTGVTGVTFDGNRTLTIENRPVEGEYHLNILKKDDKGNTLNGAKFEITPLDDNYKGLASYPKTVTTTAGGEITAIFKFKGETVEKYEFIIKEIEAPTGKKLLKENLKLTINVKEETNNGLKVLTISGTITTENGEPLNTINGVTFNLDSKTLIVTNFAKEGEYKLELTKVDENGERLDGAEFKIESKTDNPDGEEYHTENLEGNSTATFKYNKLVNTKEGDYYTYYITETKAPAGYEELSDIIELTLHVTDNPDSDDLKVEAVNPLPELDRIEFVLHDESNDELIVENIPIEKEVKYPLNITKVDENGARLAGATFEIEPDENNKPSLVEPLEVTSTQEGKDPVTITFYEAGDYKYTIKEVKVETNTNKKYVLLEEELVLTVKVTQEENELKVEGELTTASGKPLGDLGITFDKTTASITIPNKQKTGEYSLNVIKVDENGERLAGAKFKVEQDTKNEPKDKTIVNNENELDYSTEIEGNSTVTFKFNQLYNVKDGDYYTYEITETNTPTGFKPLADHIILTLHVTEEKDKLKVEVSNIEETNGVSFNGINVLTIPNEHEKVNITGTIWLDEGKGKETEWNGILDEDERLNNRMVGVNINVKLYEQGVERPVRETTTTNGTYEFNDVDAHKNYVISIEYDGVKYTTTKYLAISWDTDNNSKGIETIEDRKEFNKQFKEISSSRDDIKYELKENPDVFDEAEAITDNFKITATTDKEYKEDRTLQDISKDVIVNFGLKERDKADFALAQMTSKLVFKINGKEEQIENRQILDDNGNISMDKLNQYLVENKNETRDVYIYESDYNYRIDDYTDIHNKQNIKDISTKEDELKIEVIYTIRILNEGSVAGTVLSLKNYYSSNYEKEIQVSTNKNFDSAVTIIGSEPKEGYREAIIDTTSLGTMEGNDSKAIYIKYTLKRENIKLDEKLNVINEINSYSAYIENATDEYEKQSNGTIDKDSAPGNADILNHKQFEDDTSDKEAVVPRINETKRTISGLVWDDSSKDGIRQQGEKMVDKVTVQLVEVKEINGQQKEFIWQEMQTNGTVTKYIPFRGLNGEAIPTRDVENSGNGKYYFEDFIPGDYIIRFIYGDTVESVKLQNGTSYNGSEYASTRFGQDSKATDNDARREAVKEFARTINNEKGNILASPYLEPLDNDKLQKLADGTWMNADTAKQNVEVGTNKIEAINLGLAKRESTIKLNKKVSKVTLILNNGTVYKEYTEPNAVDKYWLQENTEIINGATLEIEYIITVSNEGEDRVSNIQIIDILPEGMSLNDTNWEVKGKEELKNILGVEDEYRKKLATCAIGKIEGAIESGESKAITMKASITLASDMDEYNYINTAEIVEFESALGVRNLGGIPGNLVGDEEDIDTSEQVAVTKPTGNTPINYILGFAVLATLGLGIFAIKKYVL